MDLEDAYEGPWESAAFVAWLFIGTGLLLMLTTVPLVHHRERNETLKRFKQAKERG